MNSKRTNNKKIRLIINLSVIAIVACVLIVRSCHLNSATHDTSLKISGRHFAGLDKAKVPHDVPEQIKDYTGFTVSFNPENKTPNWVAWELLGTETMGEEQRGNNFWLDADIINCPSTNDYKRSGYDRGHMIPAAEQKWSSKAMDDCFVMANICPQAHSLNSGAWNTLEFKERQWAQRDSALVIIAGPVYSNSDKERIGEARVRVPGAFYKVILAPYTNPPRAIGFVFPNMTAPGNFQAYSMTVDEVEQLTGIDFFYQLPDSIENIVESKTSFREWNSKKQ